MWTGLPNNSFTTTVLKPQAHIHSFQRTRSSSAVVPIFTVDNGVSSTSSNKTYRPVIFHLGQFSGIGSKTVTSLYLSPSSFMNSNFGKLTFLAFCLLAQEMLPLVSCSVGFKQQLPIRTNFA